MDAIKGTMTELYNDLSKSTSGNTVAEVSVWKTSYLSDHNHECVMSSFIDLNNNPGFQIRRLRIEIEKLQWLHQQELSEMKHNLGEILNMLCNQSYLFVYEAL